MRELKFRVWTGSSMEHNVTTGKFGTFYVNPEAKGDGLHPNDSASLSPGTTIYSEQTPVMQYTGLKDKHGVEIYEGDIVKVDGNNYHKDFNAPIVFRNGGFHIDHMLSAADLGIYSAAQDIEVIGNIWENPELLEDKTDAPQ